MSEGEAIIEQAALWHQASLRDDMDWSAFTLWLEADPRHRIAYDEVALTDALLGEHVPALRSNLRNAAPLPQQDNEPVLHSALRSLSRRWISGAMAASLVAVLALSQLPSDTTVAYATGAQSRAIALEDGSTVMLAPHSQLEVTGRDQSRMALTGGAYFDIRHDPSRELTIRAGALEVSDIGTRFDMQVDDGVVRVGMNRGRVRISGAAIRSSLDLGEGQGLLSDPRTAQATVTVLRPETVGGWRAGSLDYHDTPLALVAADLERYAGTRITVPEALRNRTFSGSLSIGDGKTAVRDLGQLMGLDIQADGAGYRLEHARR